MITKAIHNAFAFAKSRNWDKIYWAIDIHQTMIVPNYSTKEIPREFYDLAKEVMQKISKRTDIVRILYTSSHPDEIVKYIEYFKENDIHFHYINENPEINSEGYGYYERKFYFNVLMEDKAGFDPATDWEQVSAILDEYPEGYLQSAPAPVQQRINIIKGDITEQKVDAIVNAANSSLMGGGGVDGAIHRAAGRELLAACKKLGPCSPGEAKITGGFLLPAKHVIHAVGPVWYDGDHNEDQLLASAYRNSLKLAVENKARTIAFPSISTGAFRFPFDRATQIALQEVSAFLNKHPELDAVTLVAFSDKDYKRMNRLFRSKILDASHTVKGK